MMEADNNAEHEVTEKRWVMFHIHPDDLFTLLQLLPEDNTQFYAPHFPPDCRIEGAYYHAERDTFVIVLESEFFDPVAATFENGNWSGAWNEMVFLMEHAQSEEDIDLDSMWTVPADPAIARRHVEPRTLPPISPENLPDTRWAIFWIQPEHIVAIFQMMARKTQITIPTLPPDAKLVYAVYDGQRNAFGLFLSSEDFDCVQLKIDDDGGTLINCSENYLSINSE